MKIQSLMAELCYLFSANTSWLSLVGLKGSQISLLDVFSHFCQGGGGKNRFATQMEGTPAEFFRLSSGAPAEGRGGERPQFRKASRKSGGPVPQ